MQNKTQTRAAMVQQIMHDIAGLPPNAHGILVEDVADKIYMAVTNNTLLIVANVVEDLDL